MLSASIRSSALSGSSRLILPRPRPCPPGAPQAPRDPEGRRGHRRWSARQPGAHARWSSPGGGFAVPRRQHRKRAGGGV